MSCEEEEINRRVQIEPGEGEGGGGRWRKNQLYESTCKNVYCQSSIKSIIINIQPMYMYTCTYNNNYTHDI